jgi:hypothetical protein
MYRRLFVVHVIILTHIKEKVNKKIEAIIISATQEAGGRDYHERAGDAGRTRKKNYIHNLSD